MTARWDGLPAGIHNQVDGYVLQDRFLPAVKVVWEGGRAEGLDLNDAQRVVSDRYEALGDRVVRTPDDPVDLDSLAARAAGFPGRVVAVEAVWDGDAVHDWFVLLLAILDDPCDEAHLATVYRGAAVRLLVGAEDHRHPSAVVAADAGRALAAHLSVPFHFASPEVPDDEAPRWRAP
ncbi:hypothetical protein NLX86_09665 [Streptomyces sp. A3M-1-3]|nr:hypothetical protein [Streptomyces sp. A3M-1-3]